MAEVLAEGGSQPPGPPVNSEGSERDMGGLTWRSPAYEPFP
jgi:hypothetical protein